MTELPTGTVTLLFSDIEGSTALLKRLGAAYAEALDGQRRVLREAWADYGGTELGTEGDSFFVVFPTAERAVTAAAQAQRGLAAFEWPAGERVRVRMGIHTGAPSLHGDGYVGMDVHRAARIAGAAHGEQVLVSEATSKLTAECLPEQVTLKDLGSHQLKDITNPEHLFQLSINGLRTEFPPVKTLGAASSLPRPATPLVGRDGELAELTTLLASPDVRLVTLTGPGGTGKTRLAVALAQGLVDRFPDGVFFVPLAVVTSSDVMWTSIAEVLDVPPEGRIPPGFFEHVAHRSALFVLDNLEQIEAADNVVTELLDAAPQVVVITTTRRPLHVPAEHEHAVPPLELPDGGGLTQVEKSGAVQLFVQHARKVKADFSLTSTNAADVAAVCRRLDGLPLAIELAAARSKLLTPAALLHRLDKTLDLAATGRQGPSRQKTLRDTIAWSYDLLSPEQQGFFRRLGVFAGGADLDAVEAVAASGTGSGDVDALDLVAELVDASLITVAEDSAREPRIAMLETVRAFALDQLSATGELDEVRERHAHHYLGLAEQLRELLYGEAYLPARTRFETEHDNFNEALSWILRSRQPSEAPAGGEQLGLRLCLALYPFWRRSSGYFTESRQWLEQAIAHAAGTESPDLARCLSRLSQTLRELGEPPECVRRHAEAGVSMWRRLADTSGLARALCTLAHTEEDLNPATARRLFEEAVAEARAFGDQEQLSGVLWHFAEFEAAERNFDRFTTLNDEALGILRRLGDRPVALLLEQNQARVLKHTGRTEQAQRQMRDLIPHSLQFNEPLTLVALAEDYAAVLCELGEYPTALRLLGAADAFRARRGTPRPSAQQANLAEPIAKAHTALTDQEWETAYQAGCNTTVENVLTQAVADHSPT